MVFLLLILGCTERPAHRDGLTLPEGRSIPASVLSRGEVVYIQNCSACHGADGSGAGASAPYMRPAPRAFKQALFKFGGVASGELPTDEALERTIRRGLHGTPMLGWDLTPADRHAVIQYLKTFSPRWTEQPAGEAIAISEDPWGGRDAEALARGRALYHLSGGGHAGCIGCHPAYLTRGELSKLSEEHLGRAVGDYGPDLHEGRTRDSDFALALNDAGEAVETARIYATDFLTQPLRTAWPVGAKVDGRRYTAEDQRRDLYRVIAAGVGGTAMPTWKGALPEESLWALVHYVQSVMGMRDTPEGRALGVRLAAESEEASPAGSSDGG